MTASLRSNAVFLLLLVPLASCAERQLDLTNSPGMVALTGLCLECTSDMLAAPMDEGRYALIPVSAQPKGHEDGHGYIGVPSGSRFVIDEIVFVGSFEGSYLFIRAELNLDAAKAIRVGVEWVFSRDWRRDMIERLDRGEEIHVSRSDLPILRELVLPCGEKAKAPTL